MKFLRIQPLNNSAQWFTELRKAFEKEDLTLYKLPDSLLNGPVTFAGKGSLSGIQMEVQADNLRLYDLSYPSDFDQKVYKAVASHFLNLSYKLWREEVELDNVEVFCRDDEPEFLTRANRKISLLNLQAACLGKSKASRDAYMIERMHHFSVAKEVELYQVDGMNSFIWDGEPVWIPGDLEQILFSQKAFKGKLCGLISLGEFQKVLGSRVLSDNFGTLIPSKEELGSSDFTSLNMHMEQFEGARKPAKPEKLSITVGKLEEISYGMTKAIFSGKSLQDYNESLVKNGLSQGQLEIAGLAVSSMLEIAATSNGQSLADMTVKLKEKSSLTNEAAHAVANGFFKAAKEEPGKNATSSKKLIILSVAVLFVLYFIFR